MAETNDIASLRTRAAEGHIKSQVDLAYLIEQGIGVQKDYTEAVKLYQLAGESGHIFAQIRLGNLFAVGGFGLRQNYEAAAKWWRMAADQGASGAQQSLAELYARGQGVAKDPVEAFFWFQLANIRKEAQRMSQHLSAEQEEKVKKRLVDWKPSPAPIEYETK